MTESKLDPMNRILDVIVLCVFMFLTNIICLKPFCRRWHGGCLVKPSPQQKLPKLTRNAFEKFKKKFLSQNVFTEKVSVDKEEITKTTGNCKM